MDWQKQEVLMLDCLWALLSSRLVYTPPPPIQSVLLLSSSPPPSLWPHPSISLRGAFSPALSNCISSSDCTMCGASQTARRTQASRQTARQLGRGRPRDRSMQTDWRPRFPFYRLLSAACFWYQRMCFFLCALLVNLTDKGTQCSLCRNSPLKARIKPPHWVYLRGLSSAVYIVYFWSSVCVVLYWPVLLYFHLFSFTGSPWFRLLWSRLPIGRLRL